MSDFQQIWLRYCQYEKSENGKPQETGQNWKNMNFDIIVNNASKNIFLMSLFMETFFIPTLEIITNKMVPMAEGVKGGTV